MKFVPRDLGEAADVSRGGLPWRTSVKLVAVVAAVGVVVYLGLGYVGEALALRLSPQTEARVFGSLELPGAVPLGEATPAEIQVRAVFDRLKQAPDLLPLPYRIVSLTIDTPNAFALPGGTVGVTQGLLELVPSEIGMAFVLGHELGHHRHRHAMRRLGRGMAVQVIATLLFGGDLPPALASVEHLAAAAYSRDQEHEADDFGMRAVHEVYGTLDGALEFFEKMIEHHEDGAGRAATFVATHPLTTDRLARMHELKQRLQVGGPDDRHGRAGGVHDAGAHAADGAAVDLQ